MQERDLLMDEVLVERFLDGETTKEEEDALARALVRYFPEPPGASPEDFPPEVGACVEHIINSLGGFGPVDMWMLGVPGLPRFMANISRLEDLLYALPAGGWTLTGLGQRQIPEDLKHQWRQNDGRGGANELGGVMEDLLRDRDFETAGRTADRILGILLEVTASGDDSPAEREELTLWCRQVRDELREDAAGISLDITSHP